MANHYKPDAIMTEVAISGVDCIITGSFVEEAHQMPQMMCSLNALTEKIVDCLRYNGVEISCMLFALVTTSYPLFPHARSEE